jgi:hypothetical protein
MLENRAMTMLPPLRLARRLLPVLLLLIGVVRCDDSSPLEPPDSEPIQTDQQRYTLQPGESGLTATIIWSYTNPTGGPVFVVNCLGASNLFVEKEIAGGWVRAWTPVLPQCLSPPIVIQPASVRTDTLELFAGYVSNNVWPKFEVDDLDGVYRLVWDVLSTYGENVPGFGDLLPLDRRISNPFELDDPRQ